MTMDFRDSREANTDMATDAIEALSSSAAPAMDKASGADRKLAARGDSKEVKAQLYPVEVDHSRDALLTDFGKDTLKDRYLLPGETFQDLFVRVASAYADDAGHAERLYSYISRLWFMPATPVLSNGGTGRGLPISCFLNSVPDSLNGIVDTWNENVWLASRGGGIGTYWGNVRGIGEPVGLNGKTSAASSRSCASWIRSRSRFQPRLAAARLGGGLSRRVAPGDRGIPRNPQTLGRFQPQGAQSAPRRAADRRLHGVRPFAGGEWTLTSPKDGSARAKVDARGLFQKLVETRLATGEPYIIFADHVNKAMPKHHRDLGLKVSTSNLCSEITLPTGTDHLGNERTAVCCLSSLNLETWDQWKDEKGFIEDVMRFLDNVLQDFIDRAEPGMEQAAYSAMRERSVGFGVMGFHSFLQARGLPFEGAMAKSWNLRMFKHIKGQVDEASMHLATERGPCPDAADMGVMERFSCKMAIAPTASISIICGGTSACIEPIPANIYTHKTLSGSFSIRNPYLEKLLIEKSKNSDAVWNSILEQGGSVQHLDFLSRRRKRIATRRASRSTSAG